MRTPLFIVTLLAFTITSCSSLSTDCSGVQDLYYFQVAGSVGKPIPKKVLTLQLSQGSDTYSLHVVPDPGVRDSIALSYFGTAAVHTSAARVSAAVMSGPDSTTEILTMSATGAPDGITSGDTKNCSPTSEALDLDSLVVHVPIDRAVNVVK